MAADPASPVPLDTGRAVGLAREACTKDVDWDRLNLLTAGPVRVESACGPFVTHQQATHVFEVVHRTLAHDFLVWMSCVMGFISQVMTSFASMLHLPQT